jgi:hypothetical protein
MGEPGDGIVGRESELARVESFIGSVPEGPSALLLEGAAGIGKTTLWHAGVSMARARGHRVLACRAAESEARLSYAALGDLFDFEPPDLPAPQKRALDAALLRAEFEGAPRTSERGPGGGHSMRLALGDAGRPSPPRLSSFFCFHRIGGRLLRSCRSS